MAVEVLGGWDSEASFHLKEIAKKTANRSDREVEAVAKHFIARMSILLQRANGSMIISKSPSFPPAYIIGR